VPVGESDLQGEVAKLWKKWLTDEAHESFQKDGRYWTDVPGTNVTIIGLNTLTWYKSNTNTAKLPDTDPNGQDPGQQFAWANNILTILAKRRRRVYLMGHIPPGTFERYQQKKEGFHWYQTRYNDQFIKMVQNHAEVIEAQFFAHHHTDSFRLFFKNQQDHDPGIPVSYQLIAPGVTPWRSTLSKETGANNPGIRLISYDTVTGKVKEVSTYYLDLAQANKDGKADFKFEYNFTSEYNLTSINPESLYNLAKNMKKNSTLFNKYYKANTVSLESPSVCTTNCHLLHWCSITEVNYNRFNTCNAASITSLHWAAGSLLAVGLLLVNR
ncbi:Acid sphingomyelinase-like phosphodiesterase 3b-like 4, partial [Homarus americanus]